MIKISFPVNSIGSKTLNAMPWISQSFEIKSITNVFSEQMIHSSCQTLSNYLYKFRKQPAALFFKRTTISFLIRAILANQNKKFSNTRLDLFIKYLFRPVLCRFFAAVKAFFVVIDIMVVKNIFFTLQKQSSESVPK